MNQRLVLLLSSSRLYGFGFLEHAKELLINFLGKKNVKSILFIPYAKKDCDAYTALVSSTLQPWGYNVVGLHTMVDPSDAIRSADAIFVGGGNTFLLLSTLYEKNLVDVIREQVLEAGVPYIGSSAGSNIATRSIHTTNDMPLVHPPTFNALNLVPININPHYIEPNPDTKHQGETRDERILEFLYYYELPVLGLREGTSLLVEGDKAILLGDRNARLFQPNQQLVEVAPNTDLSFLLK